MGALKRGRTRTGASHRQAPAVVIEGSGVLGGTADRVLSAIVKAVDGLNERIGRVTSWLVLSMVINTFLVATLRYGFDIGWVWLQELYVWMHGTIIMVAAGYTLLHDGHVRVDIVYQAISRRAHDHHGEGYCAAKLSFPRCRSISLTRRQHRPMRGMASIC